MSAEHRRELRRRILEVMAGMRGDGWVTAADVAVRLAKVDGLGRKDGRRVAGQLRTLTRLDLIDRAWSGTEGGSLFAYRILDTGLAWLDREARDRPRLTDVPRAWPRRGGSHRVAHRHRGGRP